MRQGAAARRLGAVALPDDARVRRENAHAREAALAEGTIEKYWRALGTFRTFVLSQGLDDLIVDEIQALRPGVLIFPHFDDSAHVHLRPRVYVCYTPGMERFLWAARQLQLGYTLINHLRSAILKYAAFWDSSADVSWAEGRRFRCDLAAYKRAAAEGAAKSSQE